MGNASHADLVEAEALVLQVLDRVDAAQVGDHEAILLQLRHLVLAIHFEHSDRPAVNCLNGPLREARLFELHIWKAELLELLDDASRVLERFRAVAVGLELLSTEPERAQLDGIEAGLAERAHAKAACDQIFGGEAPDQQLLGTVPDLGKLLRIQPGLAQLPRGCPDRSECGHAVAGDHQIEDGVAHFEERIGQVAARSQLIGEVPAVLELANGPTAVLPLLDAEEDLATSQLGRRDAASLELLGCVTTLIAANEESLDIDPAASTERELGCRVPLLLETLRRVAGVLEHGDGRACCLELHQRRTRLLELLRRVPSVLQVLRRVSGSLQGVEVVTHLAQHQRRMPRLAEVEGFVARREHLGERVARIRSFLRIVARIVDALAIVARSLHLMHSVASIMHHAHLEDESLAKVERGKLGVADVGDAIAGLSQLRRLILAILEFNERERSRVLHLQRRVPTLLEILSLEPEGLHLGRRDLGLPHLPRFVTQVPELHRFEAGLLELLGCEATRLKLDGREREVEQLLHAEAHIAENLCAQEHSKMRAAHHALADELRDARLPVAALGSTLGGRVHLRPRLVEDLGHRVVRGVDLAIARLRVAILAQQLVHCMHLLASGATLAQKRRRRERLERRLRPAAQLENG